MKTLRSLYRLWPQCPTVFGQQLQSDKHSEFSRLLDQWMIQSNSQRWTIGYSFVCCAVNGQFSSALGNTPYRLMHRTTLEDARCRPEFKFPPNEDDFPTDGSTLDHSPQQIDEFEISQIMPLRDDGSVATSTGRQSPAVEELPRLPEVGDESFLFVSFRFPFDESEDRSTAEIDALINSLRIIENDGEGDCLYHVIRQHIKAFFKREYRVSDLRQRVYTFLSEEQLGRKFLRTYHPDVNPENLMSNVNSSRSWGGPESLFAVSQIFKIRVTVFSFIRDSERPPYVSRYWPVTEQAQDTLHIMPSAYSMCIKYEDSHYTLLLPKDIVFPPKRFKRKHLMEGEELHLDIFD